MRSDLVCECDRRNLTLPLPPPGKQERFTSLQALRITEAIHKEGINCRFLGLLAEQFMRMSTAQNTAKAKICRHLLLLEMVARIIKAETNRKFRELTQSLKESGTTLAMEEPYRRVAIDYLNLVFGNSDESDQHWNGTLRTNLTKKFVGDYIPQRCVDATRMHTYRQTQRPQIACTLVAGCPNTRTHTAHARSPVPARSSSSSSRRCPRCLRRR